MMTMVIKKTKGTKKYVIKRKRKFNNYKDCLLNNEIISKSHQKLKSKAHNVYTEELDNIARNSNDDKRLQTFDNITSYPYCANFGKVCNCWMQYLNAIFKYKIINFDDVTNKNKIEHNPKWPCILDHS